MFSQTLTIARNTFLESVRQPIYFILTSICGLAILLTVWTAAFSMDYSSSAVVSKEIDRKTVLTVVSKPVSRPTVVFGKYLGVTGAILIATLTMLLFVQM